MSKIALAVHGGAGTVLKSLMTAELEREYRDGLRAALEAGWGVLRGGGRALDAVEAAVCELEDFPLFNAGRGAVFTHDSKNEMDAAIMDGATLKAGAVAFVKNVKNPIRLARLVMERTEHVLLAGAGANEFARQMRAETAPDGYFFTELRHEQLLKARAEGVVQLDHAASETELLEEEMEEDRSRKSEVGSRKAETGRRKAEAAGRRPETKNQRPKTKDQKSKTKDQRPKTKPIGTVGAVACDAAGSLAAATSTGGMTNKKFGRIGDTPIVGAGTYADDRTCAVSCTGHGEYFMRAVTAYDVAARMKYQNVDLKTAARETLARLTEIGGEGGFVAVDAAGNIVTPFNSEGMYRGRVTGGGEMVIEIYR